MPTRIAATGTCKRHHNCGCAVAVCCFTCPLPDCSYGSLHRPKTEKKYQDIRELRDQGKTSTEISQELDISLRQVWRALSG